MSKARLLFGHCETLVPLVSLMGLFYEDVEGEKKRKLISGLRDEDWGLHSFLQDIEMSIPEVSQTMRATNRANNGNLTKAKDG